MVRDKGSIARDSAFFVALLATALALGSAMAHVLELPNKIGLPQEECFVVQNIYRGWDRLGYLLAVEFVSMAALIVLYWRDRTVRGSVAIALACLIAAQSVFWIFTFPANAATENWTEQPANWRILRAQWEYSHFAGAVLQLAEMMAMTFAALARRTAASHGPNATVEPGSHGSAPRGRTGQRL